MISEQQTYSNKHLAIEVVGIKKTFAARPVLNDINLAVYAKQSLCLLGVNGAGKSTLLRIIAGLLHPDQGSVLIYDYNMHTESEKTKSQLGVISHKSMVYPDLTVYENIHFFAQLYGVANIKEQAEKLLGELGLMPYRYDRAQILSRGLLQRLAIARALVHDPKILLADEPFTGLDTDAAKHLIQVMASFTENGGTIVMTTHDTAMGLRCCDRVVVLDQGSISFDSPTDRLNPAEFTEDYVSYARSHA
jgi:heme exporter protein A